MLGHTNIATTQIYARILAEKISQDMALFAGKIIKMGKSFALPETEIKIGKSITLPETEIKTAVSF